MLTGLGVVYTRQERYAEAEPLLKQAVAIQERQPSPNPDLFGAVKLRRAGHRVVTAASRADGMQLLKSVRPRLVVSDLRLPDGDGLDIIR